MKITILNGNPDLSNRDFDRYLETLQEALEDGGHAVTCMTLRDLNLHYCNGCFGCWVKTPGECLARDDSGGVRRAVIGSDLTVFASPLVMGFVSALTKKMMDKMIPLLHPYIVFDRGEMHHLARYKRYPQLGLLLQKTIGSDDEDLALASEIVSRTAINFKSKLCFTKLIEEPIQEVVNEINHI
ncbi:MAG: flavodoxin family protein [Anaerolineae bacterium]|nr:flavodoxin family protein [Anaerolineae bacterium]